MFQKNNNRVFLKALTQETPYLRRFARSLVNNTAMADDLVQDTLERAINRMHLFDHDRKLRPWLFRILRNLNISEYRKMQNRDQHIEFDTVSETHSTSAQRPDSGLILHDISKALDELPYEHREVLVLVALEGLKYREVVDVLDIPIGTVMSRLSRAREKLRDLLDYPDHKTLRRVK